MSPRFVTSTDPSPAAGEPAANGSPSPGGPDPFDPASLRLTGDLNAAVGVKKALLTIPVRKPDKSWFVRVHPDPAYQLTTAVIELKEDRETYLVAGELRSALATESMMSPRTLFIAINRQGVVFVWPVRIAGDDGRVDEWSKTALEAANRAKTVWVRVASNMSLGAYDVFEATGDFPEPEFPDVPLRELLKIAFKDRLIDSLDHPILRKLRGEI